MARQGKCEECDRVYVWPMETPINNAMCPVHKTRLRRCTSRNYAARYNVTNAEVEIIHQRRSKRTQDVLTDMGPKVGPGTD